MLDSIYHMTLKLLKNRMFGGKTLDFAIFYLLLKKNVVTLPNHKPLEVYRFYCMALNHSQTRCHMIKNIIGLRTR